MARDDAHLLAIYLRDHLAGSSAGLALVRRMREAETAGPTGDMLAALEAEIAADRAVLEAVMRHLCVRPGPFESAIARLGELLSRLTSNGRIVRRSPSSRVVELEVLGAGIVTKRNLWRALAAVADGGDEALLAAVDRAELDELCTRATRQYRMVADAHRAAAVRAFLPPNPGRRTVGAVSS